MKITFNGFGSARALRGYSLELDSGVSIAELRIRLVQELAALPELADDLSVILSSCAFASEQEVLHETSRIEFAQTLNILPPVCGG